MSKRIYTFELDEALYEANSNSFRKDVVFVKPTNDKRIVAIWMSFGEAFKARFELFYYNLLMPRKINMRRGIITK